MGFVWIGLDIGFDLEDIFLSYNYWIWVGRKEGMRYNIVFCNYLLVLERVLKVFGL